MSLPPTSGLFSTEALKGASFKIGAAQRGSSDPPMLAAAKGDLRQACGASVGGTGGART